MMRWSFGQIPIVTMPINLLLVVFGLLGQQRLFGLLRVHSSTVTHQHQVVTWELT